MLLSLSLLSASAQTLDLLGECPGPTEVTVTGLTPNRSYALISANGLGAASVPGGQPCAGTPLDLDAAGLTLRMIRTASGAGSDAFVANAPPAGCGLALQVLDVATCRTTNPLFLARPVVVATVPDVQQGVQVPNDTVRLTGVVTATDTNGVWIQDGPSARYDGIYVYLDAGWDAVWVPLRQGDVVEVQGEVREYYGLTEINVPESAARSVALVSAVAVPAPATVNLTTLVGDPEPWEGVLVRVSNVAVATLPNQYGEWSVTDGVSTILVDDQIFDASAGLAIGQRLQLVQGPLSYAFGTWRLLPRDASDVR